MPAARLPGIDLLRIFAALAVLVFHAAYWSSNPDAPRLPQLARGLADYVELTPFTWWGWVGVEIFFVISGW